MRFFSILSFILLSFSAFSQETKPENSNETSAEFPGGQSAMAEYIQKNIRIPKQAYKKHVNGKCYIKFVVEEDGSISNVSVQRGIEKCPDCDKEALRVIESMPDWIPATIDGNAVNAWFTLPLIFKVV